MEVDYDAYTEQIRLASEKITCAGVSQDSGKARESDRPKAYK